MFISEEPMNEANCVSYATATMKPSYLVMNADEHFYHFCGKVTGINFADYIYSEDFNEFDEASKSLEVGERRRLFIRVVNKLRDVYWADIIIYNDGTIIEGEIGRSIVMFPLTALERRYIHARDNLNKYRMILSLHRDYLFDYDASTGIFSMFFYRGNQSIAFIKCSLNDFRDEIMKHYTDDKEKEEFVVFYNYLLHEKNRFSCNVKLPTDSNFSDICLFKAEGVVSYTINGGTITAGMLQSTEVRDENAIPYYLTKEAIDPATGLMNKRAAKEYSESLLGYGDNQSHYMIVFDVDNFKDINDNYGHLFGDEVLSKVAEIMDRNLNGRGIVGRFGGDEFYIFTSKLKSEEDLRTLLTTIRRDVLYAFNKIKDDLHVTLSVGVSMYPKDGTTYDELFKKADKCLYIAKNRGRNRFIIYDEAKHGAISTDESRNHTSINPVEHAEDLAAYLSEFTLSLYQNNQQDVTIILDDVIKKIRLDGVRVYSTKSEEPLYMVGDYKKEPDISELLDNKAFMSCFNRNHVLMIGNTTTVEGYNKKSYNSLMECNIMAMLCFYFDKPEGERIFFFYDVFNHTNRWNESDKNYLLIISRLLFNMFINYSDTKDN